MTRPQFAPRGSHRARTILTAVSRGYPDAWTQVDRFRQSRGRELPAWPIWCYLPLHGAYAIVSGGEDRRVPLDHIHHVGILGALAAWRVTQGIYRYDPQLYAALRETPMPDDLPVSVLYRLPEWCVYLETPGETWIEGRPMHGVWIHLEWDEGGADELRLVLDTAEDPSDPLDAAHGLIPLPLVLGQGSIADALRRVVASGTMRAQEAGYGVASPAVTDVERLSAWLWPIVSLALYLCADEPDIAGDRRPRRPAPTRTKAGYRIFPPDRLTTWDVGVRIGAAIRRWQERDAREAREATASGRARPRPHIRRAHYHSFWRGPRDEARASERQLVLRWLPPIPVNVAGDDDVVTTIHDVE
ncbi:MAG TPA: hypothetical protein VM364_00655 [Vicinamibacterales bacterium]|nr:hypothetical protein [Vicinamibacterales bacterium]